MSIDIQDLDKAKLLAKLYNDAQYIGLDANHQKMSVNDAQGVIDDHGLKFETVGGRSLHIDLTGDTLDSTDYNRSNGYAAAESAVDTVRQRGYQKDDAALEKAAAAIQPS